MNTRNYKFVTLAVLVFLFFNMNATAQVGIGTTSPNGNAMLDVVSTDKGFLPPRMTTVQKTAIGVTAAEAGMLVFDTDLGEYSFWDGSAWVQIEGPVIPDPVPLGNIYFSAGGGLTTTTAVGVKLNGTTAGVNLQDFAMPSNNTLQYTGTETKVFTIHMTLSFLRASNTTTTQQFQFWVAKGGTVVPGVVTLVVVPPITGFQTETVSLTGTVSLATSDFVEVYVANAGTIINVTNMNLVLSE